MRWTLAIGIILTSATLTALAVTGERAPEPQPAAATGNAIVRIDIPVAWQLTRSRMLGPGAPTMTESFRETWTLEVRPGGFLFLQSPRARVVAYVAGPHTAKPEVPKAVVVSERDFARLVGVKPDGEQTTPEEPESPSGPVDRPVTLTLAKTGRGGMDVSLSWSEEEHFAVHIDVGSTTLF